MRKSILALAILVLVGAGCSPSEPAAAVPVTPTDENVENAPVPAIIDIHAHIQPSSGEANEAFVAQIVEAARAAGVTGIVLGLNARQVPQRPPTYSETHDEWVLDMADRYPDLIIPALNGFDPSADASVEYVRDQLATGSWKAIGELDLRNRVKQTVTPADHPVMLEIYKLAADAGVPVIFHYDFEYGTDKATGHAELERAVAENPQTNFVFAHSCGPQAIDLMDTYDNLYCEIERGSLPQGVDASRVVLGTDVQVNGPPGRDWEAAYAEMADGLRAILDGLDAETAEDVAHGNAERLLGL